MRNLILIIFLIASILITGCQNSSTTNQAASNVQSATVESTNAASANSSKTETIWVSTPESSAFTKIGYNEGDEILLVVFRESGLTYEYEQFSTNEWDDFLAADSKGTWYNTKIKPFYDYSDKY